jgi:hypothetical protein
MTLPHTEADKLARSLLAKQGIGAIWRYMKRLRQPTVPAFAYQRQT